MIAAPESTIVRAASVGEAMQIAGSGAPRFILGMPDEAYHSRSELSASGMKVLLRSPKHFQASRGERKRKKEFEVGHAVHARVLGVGLPVVRIPDELLSGPYKSISSNAAKAWVAQAEADGKTALKPSEYELVVKASDAVLKHPKARRLLEVAGESEVSMFATDPETEVALRGRADRISGSVISDVKTTTDLRTFKLQRVVEDFGYDLSAETYRMLFRLISGADDVPPVQLVFCEKEQPYDVRLVELGETWQVDGWRKLRRALVLYRACMDSREWPGMDDGDGPVEVLEAPGWVQARNENETEGDGWF